ncbi:MAG TPA: DHHA1 domain-containing protein [Tepidisphaeraceae bacterium]|jgi:single-stranded-DNA-specific exonuclease
MQRSKRWNIAEAQPGAGELAERLRTSPLIAQVLLNRGIGSAQECQAFLRPSLKSLPEPAGIANLSKASERVAKAIRDGEKIVIYGDYDVDGITATAILWHAITLLGGKVDFYIPHRIDEGYGLNTEAMAQICDGGAKVIVTVDCGITAVEQAKLACARGVDLIITDHHEWHEGEEERNGETARGRDGDGDPLAASASSKRKPLLPECFTIVHPRMPGHAPAYANPALCGAGVAFKLAWGIGLAMSGANRVSEAFRNFLVDATALAALGTIADVVPLVGENRILAHFGLGGLKQSKLMGLRALIESAGLTGQNLDSYHVGFLLAPRLNACGRMGHARLAVEMLTRADEAKAKEIATYLEQQNRARQTIEKQILEQALQQVRENKFDEEDCRAIVLGAEGWHAGVIGIVASRIVDRLGRPTVMVALHNGHGQGSARSIPGFHLAKAFEACAEHLEGFGGHEMAAGLKLQSAKFGDFRAAFCAHAREVISREMLVPELHLECLAELKEVTEALVKDLQRLGPFGHGNRKPLLCCRGLQIASPPRRVGKAGEHLQLFVRQGESSMKCIAFNYGAMLDRLGPGTTIDLAVEPSLNEYNGRVSVELDVKDLQFST